MSAIDQPVPWYKRNILPVWVPGWLAACLLIAAGFAVMFGLFLDDANPWRVAAIAAGCGFAIGVVILSAAAMKYRGLRPNPFAPPAVVRYPVVTLMLVLPSMGWAVERRITRAATRGGGIIVDGDAAEVIGLVVLFSIVAGLTLLVVRHRRRGVLGIPAGLSLAVAVMAFGYAIVRVVQYHAG